MRLIVFIVVILLITIFAYIKEKKEQPNSYLQGLPNDSDTIPKIIQKLRYCLSVDQKTIKWRRSLFASVIVTTLIFIVIHWRFPELKELLLYLSIVYFVYYMTWQNYTDTISKTVTDIGEKNLKNLKICLRQKIASFP